MAWKPCRGRKLKLCKYTRAYIASLMCGLWCDMFQASCVCVNAFYIPLDQCSSEQNCACSSDSNFGQVYLVPLKFHTLFLSSIQMSGKYICLGRIFESASLTRAYAASLICEYLCNAVAAQCVNAFSIPSEKWQYQIWIQD